MFHGKREWGGTIPPVGIRGERPETEIRRGPPAPFLRERERERERETEWGERRMGMGEFELPLPVFNPHAPSTVR